MVFGDAQPRTTKFELTRLSACDGAIALSALTAKATPFSL
jgi:hypothetical protein